MKIINDIKISIIDENENVYAKNLLISVYSKCKDVTNAMKVFDSIPKHKRNVHSMNAMIKCFIDNKQNNKAILLYEQRSDKGQCGEVTNLLFITACINTRNYDKAKHFIDPNFRDRHSNNYSVESLNTLIVFYGRIGCTNENKKDVISIATMMKCYIENNKCKALELYNRCCNLHLKTISKWYNKSELNYIFASQKTKRNKKQTQMLD